jgi:hypothetical protein
MDSKLPDLPRSSDLRWWSQRGDETGQKWHPTSIPHPSCILLFYPADLPDLFEGTDPTSPLPQVHR